MASSLSISRASAVMGSILDRSIDIPRDISFRGVLELVDKDGSGAQAKVDYLQLGKLVDIEDGIVLSNKTIITDSSKNISGVNNQTNTGQFIIDSVKNTESPDFIFKTASGTNLSKAEIKHGNNIGNISFTPYVNGGFYDSAGIEIKSYKKGYSGNYIGSEIIFSNTGGSDVNSGKHESIKIDSAGNLNILQAKGLKFNAFKDTIYSGFRPSTSMTSSDSYVMELPSQPGQPNQILKVASNGYGSGGIIRLRSNPSGTLIDPPLAQRITGGSNYDENNYPEVNTNVFMTGGRTLENGTCSQGTSTVGDIIYLASSSNTNDKFYNGWTIETINPNAKIIIYDYEANTNRATLSSPIPQTTTLTQYKLKQGHGSVEITRTIVNNTNIYTLYNYNSPPAPNVQTLSDVDNYYTGWTLVTDVSGTLYTGEITSYDSTSKEININWTNEPGDTVTVTNAKSSLTNDMTVPASIKITNISGGQIDDFVLLDGGSGYIPNIDVVINIPSQSKLQWGTLTALSQTQAVGNLTTGAGLSGSGSFLTDIDVSLELSSLDPNGSTEEYESVNNDKIIIQSVGGTNMPKLSKFLSSITGTGLTSETVGNLTQIRLNNELSIVTNISDHFSVYSLSNNITGHYFDIGKDINNNIKFYGSYDGSDNLEKTIIKTQSTNAGNNASIQYDIGNKEQVMNIDENGVSVKRGMVTGVTIDNSGGGYTSAPTITFDTSPFGANYTAQGICVLDRGGGIESVTITNPGLGYSSSEPPSISIVGGGGTNASLSAQVNDTTSIVGEINNENVYYNGYFKDLTIFGDQQFEGVLKIVGQGAVELGKPSNLDFSENDSSFIFGYQAGSGTSNSVRITQNRDITLIGYKTGFKSSINSQYNTFCGSNSGFENTDGTKNTYIGYKSGEKGTTSVGSVFVGNESGVFLTGSYNTALGNRAGCGGPSSGHDGGHDGSYNVYLGNESGVFLKGSYNTALGNRAGYGPSPLSIGGHSGSYNVYLGDGIETAGGDNNLFAGCSSGKSASSSNGVFLGFKSGFTSSGDGNVLIGYESGYTATTTSYNVLIGYQSGYNISMEDTTVNIGNTGNVMLGYRSGYNLDGQSSRNIIIGYNAGPPNDEENNTNHNKLYISTRGESLTPLIFGDQVDVTLQTLSFNADVTINNANSGGTLSVKGGEINIHGPKRGTDTTNGKIWSLNIQDGAPSDVIYHDTNLSLTNYNNTFDESDDGTYCNILIGNDVCANNGTTKGKWNVMIGSQVALDRSTLGDFNVAVGGSSLYNIDNGTYNTSCGYSSLMASTSGNNNSAYGAHAGYKITSGHSNSLFGMEAGYNITTGNYNICIGRSSGPVPASESSGNRLYIDMRTTPLYDYGSGADSLIYGDQSTTTHTISFNADVVINKHQAAAAAAEAGETNWSGGNLTVEGGEIKFFDKTLRDGDTTNGEIWIMSSPGDGTQETPNGNLVISNDTNPMGNDIYSSLIDADTYTETTIIGYGVRARGNHTTILGADAGYSSVGNLHDNTFIGYKSGSYFTTGDDEGVQQNTFIGSHSGSGIDSTKNTICIGYQAGFPSSEDNQEVNNLLIIDASGSPQGSSSLIWGDQSSTTHTMNLNADVTIVDGSNSSGNLNVDGSILCSTLSISSNNIDITSADRNSLDNLLITNNTHNLDLSQITKTTIFATFKEEINNMEGEGNSLFGYGCGTKITSGKYNTLIGVDNNSKQTTGNYNVSVGNGNMNPLNIEGDSGDSGDSGGSNISIGSDNMSNMGNAAYLNIAIGTDNCKFVTSEYNIGIGYACLKGKVGGSAEEYCIALGNYAGESSSGDHNIMMGHNTGRYISGDYNICFGTESLGRLEDGSHNIGIGYNACRGNHNPTEDPPSPLRAFSDNIGIGNSSLLDLDTAKNSICIGVESGKGIQTGNHNIGIGYQTLKDCSTGHHNIAIGQNSGDAATGNYNVSIGYQAGRYTYGNNNISIGKDAGPAGSQTSDSAYNDQIIIDTTLRGSSSLIYGNCGTSTQGQVPARTLMINGGLHINLGAGGDFKILGSNPTFVANLQGEVTVPNGKKLIVPSLNVIDITSSSETSIYLGYQSGSLGSPGPAENSAQVCLGYQSGENLKQGSTGNTYIGYYCGKDTETSGHNTALGREALVTLKTGEKNTSIGSFSGSNILGKCNTCIGYKTGPYNSSEEDYRLYIDAYSSGRGMNCLIYGVGGPSYSQRRLDFNAEVKVGYGMNVFGNMYVSGSCYVGGVRVESDISLKKDIVGIENNIIEKINLLKPVNYKLKSSGVNDIGFIAQDVQNVFPLLVKKNIKKNILTIDYQKLTSYIVKGMQETNNEIKELKNELNKEKQKRESMEAFFKEEIEKLRKEILRK